MNGDRPPSPLSFAFNFHNQRRRASLQHVFVRPGQQYDHHQIQDHRSIVEENNHDKQALVTKLKEVKEKTFGVRNINAMRRPNSIFQEEGTTNSSTILQQEQQEEHNSRLHLVVSKLLLPATGSIHDMNNTMHSKNQIHLQKLNKAKEDLRSKYHDKNSYHPRQKERSDVKNAATMNEVIPGEPMLPRSYDEIRNDFIHLHRRHSIAASGVSTTNIVSGLVTQEERYQQVNEGEKSRRTYKNQRRRHKKKYHKKQVKEQCINSRYDNRFDDDSFKKPNEEEESDTIYEEGTSTSTSSDSDNSDDDNDNSDHALCFKATSKPFYDQTTQVSSTIMNQKQQYTKDYIKLVQDYKKMSCYLHGNPKLKRKCIVCKRKAQTSMIVKRTERRSSTKQKRKSKQRPQQPSHREKYPPPVLFLSKVLFPCQHRCICSECWESQTFIKCPFCNEEIKIAIDYSGKSSSDDGGTSKEEEQYWDWINEIKPHLPNGFLKSFARNSRRAISEAMAKSIMDDGYDDEVDSDDKLPPSENDEQENCHTSDDLCSSAPSLISLSKSGNEKPSHFHNRETVDSKVCIIS